MQHASRVGGLEAIVAASVVVGVLAGSALAPAPLQVRPVVFDPPNDWMLPGGANALLPPDETVPHRLRVDGPTVILLMPDSGRFGSLDQYEPSIRVEVAAAAPPTPVHASAVVRTGEVLTFDDCQHAYTDPSHCVLVATAHGALHPIRLYLDSDTPVDVQVTVSTLYNPSEPPPLPD